jgi:hypothetical protein
MPWLVVGDVSENPEPPLRFDLPGNVLGYLEWSSGLLRINATLEEWTAVKNRVSQTRLLDGSHPFDPRAASLIRAVTHEQFHFLQVITTGYPYSLACVVFIRIMQHLSAAMGSDETLKQWVSLSNELAPPLDVQEKFAELDMKSAEGLTIRYVIESAAHLYECKSHMPGLDHQRYLDYLAAAKLPPEYRATYEAATKVVGPAAFSIFLPAAAVALCFRWPNEVLGVVLGYMDGDEEPGALANVLNAIADLKPRYEYLGTAVEIATGQWSPGTPLVHPFYTQALRSVLAHSSPERLLLLTMHPDQMKGLAPLAAQPVLFNDDRVQLPVGFEGLGAQFAVPAGHSIAAVSPEEFVNTWITIAMACRNIVANTGHQLHYRVQT